MISTGRRPTARPIEDSLAWLSPRYGVDPRLSSARITCRQMAMSVQPALTHPGQISSFTGGMFAMSCDAGRQARGFVS
jgi:hypothetical protein